jgi:hypothetical protein
MKPHNAITGVQHQGRKRTFYRCGMCPTGRLIGYVKSRRAIVWGWLEVRGGGFFFDEKRR